MFGKLKKYIRHVYRNKVLYRNRKFSNGEQHSRFKKLKIFLAILLAVSAAVIGGVAIRNHVQNERITTQRAQDSNKAPKVVTPIERKTSTKQFVDSGSIPNKKTLDKDYLSNAKLRFVGYLSIPVQKGVTTPINALQINEGSTDINVQKKAMATGAVTSKVNEVMGQRNFAIDGHNVGYGNGKLLFSPMQKGITVNDHPKAYLSDGKNLYVYTFYAENDEVAGRKSIPAEKGGYILDDDIAEQHKTQLLTMYTCDEPGPKWESKPKNRIVMVAHLTKAAGFNSDSVSNFERSLFPAYNN